MGRAPCCDKEGLKKGPWTPDEDQKLIHYIQRNGHGSWREIPKRAGLLRCGKSCRLRWTNYLRPDIKRGKFSSEEDQTIIQLHAVMGNKWSTIAGRLPGRTDNEIKNHWHTHLKKSLLQMGIDPVTHRPRTDLFDFTNMSQFLGAAALSQMTATSLQEAVIREHLRIAAAAIIQQGVDHYTENASAISATDLLLRSQLENYFFRPDFTNTAMTPPCWLHISENQPGSSEYQNLEQMQYQNIEDSSPILIPNINPEQEDINNQAIAIPDEEIDSNKIYNSVLNDPTMMLQQQPPSKSQEIISSLPLWPGDSNGVSKSVPALTPFTSSINKFDTSSTGDESYAFPPEFPVSFSENNKEIPDMRNSEEEIGYWSTMLKYVAET